MKILRLDLRAFGSFSHEVFNFDPKKKVHFLFGENEAGKSSIARALKALFFGIEKNSEDAYLHPQENLFIEGLLENNSGQILQIIRDRNSSRKQNQILQELFPKLNKENFAHFFCLNQETIRIGSKDLLENMEHFDRSLFSTFQGCRQIASLLKSIEIEIEELYKARGVKPVINQKIQRISDLLKEKDSLKLSYQKWNELNKKRNDLENEQLELDIRYKNLSSRHMDMNILKDIYDLIPKYLELQTLLQEKRPNILLSKNELIEYKELILLLEQISAQKSEINTFIQNLDKKINQTIFDSKFIDHKADLEILFSDLKHYELSTCRKEKNESDLLELKTKFKQLNLALQKEINISLSFEVWQELKPKILKIIEEYKVLNYLKSDKSLKIISEKNKLEQLKSQYNQIKCHEKISLTEDKILVFNHGINIENERLEVEKKINTGLDTLRHNSLRKKSFTVSQLKKIILNFDELKISEVELTELKIKYSHSLKKYKSLKDKVGLLLKKKSKSTQIDLNNYHTLKKKRQQLKLELIEPWNVSSYLEKYALFLKYQSLIDEEDMCEAYFFSNIDKLAEEKKLLSDIDDFRNEMQVVKYQLDIFIYSLYKMISSLSGFFKKINFENEDHIASLIDCLVKSSYIKKQMLFLNDLSIEETVIRKKLYKYTKAKGSIEEMKCHFLKEVQEKKQSFLIQTEMSQQIVFTSNLIKKMQSELKELNSRDKNIQKNWVQIAFKSGIKTDFDLNKISQVITHLDSFFELSKIITLKNDLVKNDLKLIQQFQSNLTIIKRKTGFTNLKENNIKLYIEKAANELSKKNDKDCLQFLKTNKLKDTESLLDKEKNAEKKLDYLVKKASFVNLVELSASVQNSEEYYKVLGDYENLKSLLELKCKPKNLGFYLSFKKIVLSKTLLFEENEKLQTELKEVISTRESIQKMLGEIDFQKQCLMSFSKKYELDEELQAEIYDLDEKIEHYITVKSSARILKKCIWDFQQKNQDSLLKMASTYFKKITNGRYVNVELNILDQKQSFLICENCNNEKVTIDLLSEGTRDQLFLSLKLAMGKLYINENTFPLILDDVLVNFDDKRSISCLNLLKELSQSFQIIFLTHHKHILKLIEQSTIKNSAQVIKLNSAENVFK